MKLLVQSLRITVLVWFSLLAVGCSNPSRLAVEPESEIRNRLIQGSEFNYNHGLLSDDGWIMISGESCSGNKSSQIITYVREADPSYSLALTYSNQCILQHVSIQRRRMNEL